MWNQIRRELIFPGSQTQGIQLKLPTYYRNHIVGPIEAEQRGWTIYLLCGEGESSNMSIPQNSLNSLYLLYFYGNGMCLSTATFEFDYFREIGINVIISEYIGYGMSSGTASERNCELTARAAYSYITEIKGIPPEQIVLAGWSLGAAVATYLAKEKPVAGLIILSAFTSIHDAAPLIFPSLVQKIIPTGLVQYAVPENFDNLSKIGQVKCPIFIGHGTNDELIPFSMSNTLYTKAKSSGANVKIYPVQGAKHNDLFDIGGEKLRNEIILFLKKL